jgi:hypothetical protein
MPDNKEKNDAPAPVVLSLQVLEFRSKEPSCGDKNASNAGVYARQ